jgi:hypothetical protein
MAPLIFQIFTKVWTYLIGCTKGNFDGFIYYNVQYVLFIVAYITLKLELEIRTCAITLCNMEWRENIVV